MKIELPEIPEDQRTPLVLRLLDIISTIAQHTQQLEDEVARLKGLPPRPKIAPSTLEQPPDKTTQPPKRRPGSDKRHKTSQLTVTRDVILQPPDVPEGSTFKGFEDYVVQELVIHAEVVRYRRARWLTPEGRTLTAVLPPEVERCGHFSSDLITFVLHQYHHQHVTQPLLLEELRQFGIDISAGQLSHLLTEELDDFHQEKEELLPAGLEVSSYIQVDDTGARHQGKNGYCLHIGNDLFASFASTDNKSRLNFLEELRRPHTDYVINAVTQAYWERQQLSVAVMTALTGGVTSFADAAAWQAHLKDVGVTGERHVRTATEGALLGSLIEHGVSPELVILSDGAPQFDVLVHAACWIHAERPLTRMVPYSEPHRQAIEGVRRRLWELYQDLKTYQESPNPTQKAGLTARFDALCAWGTGFPSVDGVLREMAEHKEDLLRVLERPEVPLHNNVSESHLRDYVKKRKISGGTRSAAGRRARDTFASLKKTCRCLGVNFWDYLRDRVRGAGVLPRLGELIRRQAAAETGPGGGVVAAPA
jgi:Transposase IS66 family